MPTKPPTKFGPAELAHYRAEEIDPRTNAEWRKERMTHTPAPPWEQLGITEAAWHEREALAAEIAETSNAPAREPGEEGMPGEPPTIEPESTRKPRSDRGVKRGPKSPGEPEVSALAPTGEPIPIALTDVQRTDLEAEAARWMKSAGLDARYLTASPAEVLLNARVQKHWRTLVGK